MPRRGIARHSDEGKPGKVYIACRLKTIAADLRQEARDYDERWPMQYASQLEELVKMLK